MVTNCLKHITFGVLLGVYVTNVHITEKEQNDSHHLSEADLKSVANQLSLDPVESVGVLASSSRLWIPSAVDVPASTRFSGRATSRMTGTADSLGGRDGLGLPGLPPMPPPAPPAEPWLLLVVAALPMLLFLGMAPLLSCCCCSAAAATLLALMLPVREPAPSEIDVC